MSVPITAMPTSERPRERLLARGVEALSDQELLAVVLRSGVCGVNATDLASALLARHGGLAALATAHPEDLARTPGIGPAKATALVAAFALGTRAATSPLDRPTVRRPEDVAEIAQRALDGLSRERVVVLICGGGLRLIRVETISDGGADRSLFPVREILNAVLRHDGRAFALAHNHPSGDPAPSPADHQATTDVRAAASTVGLRFLGHVVVAGARWQAVS